MATVKKRKQYQVPSAYVGCREWVSFPDWQVSGLKAKIDTGARTSAVDVALLEELPGERVRFELVVSRSQDHRVMLEAPIARRALIRSSLGHDHERIMVLTRLRLGALEHEAEVGLVCRRKMSCRMLVGRSTLAGHYLVDTGRAFIHGGTRYAPPLTLKT